MTGFDVTRGEGITGLIDTLAALAFVAALALAIPDFDFAMIACVTAACLLIELGCRLAPATGDAIVDKRARTKAAAPKARWIGPKILVVIAAMYFLRAAKWL